MAPKRSVEEPTSKRKPPPEGASAGPKRKLEAPAASGATSSESAKKKPSGAAASYQWLAPHEAVLQRPDMFVGSNDPVAKEGRLLDASLKRVQRKWCISGIFEKIFDEAAVNAVDAASRDSEMRNIHFSFSREDGSISVLNDGKGIPIELFWKDGVETQRYIPEVVFTELSAGSNFDDSQTRLLGGRNGVGISCTNIWSVAFDVEIHDGKKSFRQAFRRNLTERDPPVVQPHVARNGRVLVRYLPDYARLELAWREASELLEELLRTRASEIAICARPGIAVFFNDVRLPCKPSSFAAELFGTEEGLICESFGQTQGAGVEVTIGPRKECEPFCAFVNGIRCDGGTLAQHLFSELHKAVCVVATKQKVTAPIRMQTVKEHLTILAVARIDKPRFTNQSKDTLATPYRGYGFSLDFPDKLQAKLARLPAVEALIRRDVEQELASAMKKVAPSKKSVDVNIEKYDPALDCRKCPLECTLILTEGDSAKALAVAGLSVVGRERFGVFPLRGKVLNVRNKPLKTSICNKEIAALLKILNLSPGGGAENLRYGRVAIFTDQDSDGAHIAGLLLNALHCFFPRVIQVRPDFVCRIVTPLIKATPKRGNGEVLEFFSVQGFNSWASDADASQYAVKYFKGLGTSTSKDAKEIFRRLQNHTLGFDWDPEAEARLVAFFDDKHVAERKRILTEDYSTDLSVDFGASRLKVSDFLSKDLVHYSMYSTFRGIASAIDGLTPSRRKAVFYFLSNKGNSEVKVAQAAAGVAQKTMYLHGETSLVESIVGLAQEHVGTNNVALLLPLGQFGSRLDPPGVHAAARYIFTKLSNITRCIFPKADDDVLEYRSEEGESIEPKHFCAVIPMVLVNGASGIATGFSSSVPCHSLPSVVAACRAVIAKGPVPTLPPHYEDFVGPVTATHKGVETRGLFRRLGPSSIEITELPVGRWTDAFLTDLKEAGDKAKHPVTSIVNRSTDTAVSIELNFCSPVDEVSDEALVKALKLSESVPNTFMWLHDADYKLRLFENYEEIVREHAHERLRLYEVRKEYLLRRLRQDLELARGRAAFVRLVVDDKVKLKGKKRVLLEQELASCGLAPLKVGAAEEASYDYALGMSFSACTEESITKLAEASEGLAKQIELLQSKTAEAMWSSELDDLLVAHAEYLRLRADRTARSDEGDGGAKKARVAGGGAKAKAKSRTSAAKGGGK